MASPSVGLLCNQPAMDPACVGDVRSDGLCKLAMIWRTADCKPFMEDPRHSLDLVSSTRGLGRPQSRIPLDSPGPSRTGWTAMPDSTRTGSDLPDRDSISTTSSSASAGHPATIRAPKSGCAAAMLAPTEASTRQGTRLELTSAAAARPACRPPWSRSRRPSARPRRTAGRTWCVPCDLTPAMRSRRQRKMRFAWSPTSAPPANRR